MKCPRCETIVLDERDRDGITVDICRQCRGVWLDRGELERLIARAAEETGSFDGRRFGRDDEDYDYRGRRDERSPRESRGFPDERRRRRNWLESLTDIFD